MNALLEEVSALRKEPVHRNIEQRLREFSAFSSKSNDLWFSELCFCILTANSKAETALKIEAELGPVGFCSHDFSSVRACIMRHKHRFHNHKASYIIAARDYQAIKPLIQELAAAKGQEAAREWLATHVKGLGYKEASHFLRNVGYFDLAVLDRHILRLMKEHGFIAEIPKVLTRKSYLSLEQKFRRIATGLKMSCAELDMYMWYLRTGRVLK